MAIQIGITNINDFRMVIPEAIEMTSTAQHMTI